MRRHLGAGAFLAVVAVVALYRLCLLGQAPYDAHFQDRFRPWATAASVGSAAPALNPNIAALHPRPQADPLDRYRTYFAREMNEDLDLFVWPDHESIHRSVQKGALPLWRPGVFGGVPELAVGSPTLFSPLSWPALLLPLVGGRTVTLLLHLLLAGLGFYAFAIDRRRSRAAAALGAAVYMLNPIFTIYLYYGDFVPVFALAPVALVVIRRLFDSPAPWRPAAALAAITALELLSGNVQFGLYALAMQGVAALLGRSSDGKRGAAWAWIAGATAVGVLAASIQLLPLAEVAALSMRTPDKYAATNSLSPLLLLAWPFPALFGHPAHGDYVGGFLFFRHFGELYGVSAGVVALALAIHGARARAGRRAAIGVVAIVGVLVALSVPPVHTWLAAILPGLDALHVTRILVVAFFLQALLAADGADLIFESTHAPRLALALPLVMLALVAVLEIGRLAAGADASRFWLHIRYLARSGTLLVAPRIIIPLALAAVVALFAHRPWRWTRLALPALAAVEVLGLALPTFVGAPASAIRPPTEIVTRLRAAIAAHPGRMVGLTEPDSFPPTLGDHLPPNMAAADGFADLRAFLRLPPMPMTELVTSAAPSGSFEYFAVRDVDRPLYNLLDVRYVLSAHALDPARFTKLAPGLYENPRALGRAFFTRCAIVEPDAERRLQRLTAPDFSPFAAAILAQPVALAPTCAADDAPFAVDVHDSSATTVRLAVDAPADGVVVLTDAWFPGWRVTIDGVPGELLRVDHALRGVLVTRGRHAIELRYAPGALADGAWMSLFAWLIIAAAAAWDRLRRLPLSDDALIALGATVLLAAFAGRDLLPNDNDALYAGVIRTLRHGGSLVDLRLGSVPFLDKPPLFFWLGALVTAVAGESELALRLVPIAAGVLGAVLVARTTRRLTSSRAAAVFAAFALCTAPNYYEYSRRVYMEVPNAVLGYWAFDLGLRERWKRAGVAAGLAFMLKSIPGLLGLSALGVAHLSRRRLPRGLLVAAAIALALVVPWHLLAWHANPTAFLDFTVNLHLKHQIAEAQPWSRGGPLFYPEVLATTDTVIGLCLLGGVIVAARDFRRTRSFVLGSFLIAVVLQLALYTLSATKKPFYILTLYPFAAVLGARALAPFLDGKVGSSMTAARSRALVAAALALIFIAKNGALFYPSLDEREATYIAPLARRMAALAPPGVPLYSYESYLAAPQFYSGRDVIYALGDAPTVQMLMRIPYLRYAHDVVTWSDDLLRRGAWVLSPIDRAGALVARVPGTRVVARNAAFVLLQGP